MTSREDNALQILNQLEKQINRHWKDKTWSDLPYDVQVTFKQLEVKLEALHPDTLKYLAQIMDPEQPPDKIIEYILSSFLFSIFDPQDFRSVTYNDSSLHALSKNPILTIVLAFLSGSLPAIVWKQPDVLSMHQGGLSKESISAFLILSGGAFIMGMKRKRDSTEKIHRSLQNRKKIYRHIRPLIDKLKAKTPELSEPTKEPTKMPETEPFRVNLQLNATERTHPPSVQVFNSLPLHAPERTKTPETKNPTPYLTPKG